MRIAIGLCVLSLFACSKATEKSHVLDVAVGDSLFWAQDSKTFRGKCDADTLPRRSVCGKDVASKPTEELKAAAIKLATDDISASQTALASEVKRLKDSDPTVLSLAKQIASLTEEKKLLDQQDAQIKNDTEQYSSGLVDLTNERNAFVVIAYPANAINVLLQQYKIAPAEYNSAPVSPGNPVTLVGYGNTESGSNENSSGLEKSSFGLASTFAKRNHFDKAMVTTVAGFEGKSSNGNNFAFASSAGLCVQTRNNENNGAAQENFDTGAGFFMAGKFIGFGVASAVGKSNPDGSFSLVRDLTSCKDEVISNMVTQIMRPGLAVFTRAANAK